MIDALQDPAYVQEASSAFVLVVLFGTAAWDARTGRVPDTALVAGACVALVALFLTSSLHEVVTQILMAVGCWSVLWGLNEVWFRLKRQDAIGMGDAKWTALAALTFGLWPALWAWLAGAWFALAWMGAARLGGYKLTKVYFAPFLFCGLLLALVVMSRLPHI